MIKHTWSIICKEGKINDEGVLSIVDVYDSLQFAIKTSDKDYKNGNPITLDFDFQLVSLFTRESRTSLEKVEERIVVTDPGGREIGSFNADIVFQPGLDRMRNIMAFPNITLTTSGIYTFEVSVTSKEHSEEFRLVGEVPVAIEIDVTQAQESVPKSA